MVGASDPVEVDGTIEGYEPVNLRLLLERSRTLSGKPPSMATAAERVIRDPSALDLSKLAPHLATAVAFVVLFREPLRTTAIAWWTNPTWNHGLLTAPLAAHLAWQRGIVRDACGQRRLGLSLLVAAVLLQHASELATGGFTMRLAMVAALFALVILARGLRQLVHWGLPLMLLLLSVPIPDAVLRPLILQLQLAAAQAATTLLVLYQIPVILSDGTHIHLPGHTLVVAEECSGINSLVALLCMSLLVGGLWFRNAWSRTLLVIAVPPVAVALNGVRIFMVAFLILFVDPEVGRGLKHLVVGWLFFLSGFGILGAVAWALLRLERRWGVTV